MVHVNMKKYLVFLVMIFIPHLLFAAGGWYCDPSLKPCTESDLRNSLLFIAKVGFFLLLVAYLVGFFVEAAKQYGANQFEGPAFRQFLKGRLSLLVFMVVLLLAISNFASLMEVFHINKDIVSVFKSLIGSK